MSLDITSHPGRPGHEELVPSRYALRVGEIDVMVVSDGVFPLPTTTMSTNADPAARAAWLKDMFLPPDAFDWALNVLVVRSGEPDHPRRRRARGGVPGFPAGRAVPQAAGGRRHRSCIRDRRGDDPHAHGPCWRAARRRGEERLRPDLRIHVAAAEVAFWESPDFSHTSMPPPVPDVLRSTAKRFVNEYRSQLRTFEEEHEVAPGVVVTRTGGHTPGTAWSAGVRRRPADLRRRRPVPGRLRPPRLAQRLRT